MSTVIAVLAFVLLAICKKRLKFKFAWVVNALLALIGGAFLAASFVGPWLTDLAAALAGFVGGWVGTSAAIVAGAAVLVMMVIIVLDLSDGTADGTALAGLVLLPILFGIAAGPIAENGQNLAPAVREMGDASIGRMIGG